MPLVHTFLGGVGVALLFLGVAAGAWRGAVWVAPEAGPPARLAAFLLLLLAIPTVSGLWLAEVGGLWMGPMLGIAALCGLSGLGAAPRLRADADVAWQRWLEQPRLVRAALVAVGLAIAWMGLRALALPPLAWDDLTYHFVKIARLVQHGGYVPERGPDSVETYDRFGYAGEVLFAWVVVPFHGDTLGLLGPWAVVVAAGAATFCLGRTWGLPTSRSLGAAAIVAGCPAVLRHTIAAYVDVLVLTWWLLGAVFLTRFWREGRPTDATLAVLAHGLAAATKLNGAPAAAATALVVLLGVIRHRDPRGLAALLAFGLVCPQFLHTWHDTGSPLWPFGLPGLPGDAAMAASFARGTDGAIDWPVVALCEFFLSWPLLPSFVNLGPAALGVGIAAAASVGRVRRIEPGVALVGALGLLAFALPLGTESFRSQLAVHLVNNGRLMLVPFVVLVLAARGRWLPVLAIVELAWALPTDRSAADVATLLVAAPALAVVVPAWALRRTPIRAAILAVLVAGPAAVAVDRVRDATRGLVRAAAATPSRVAFWHAFLPTGQAAVDAWPLWQALDDGAPHQIAWMRGYDGDGMGIFRYGLFGTRLQNTVVCVPEGPDGRVLDHWRLDPRDLDEASWLREVERRGIDRVWIAEPAPASAAFVAHHPERFELVGEAAGARLYRVITGP